MKIKHKGLSYVEVLIVLGIGAIVTSLAFVSIGFINRNNVTKATTKLENAFSHAQNMSMTKGKDNGCITIAQDSGAYYYYFGTSSTNRYKFANSPCVVTGIGGDGTEYPVTGTGLRYYFKSNTGGVETTDTDTYNAEPIYVINIKNSGGTSMNLSISTLTGKVTVQ